MIEYKMLYLPQKKSDKVIFSCIAFDTSFYFNIQAMRLILERGESGQISIRGALHLQVDVHNDDDSIIDAYNEIETTVEKMKPTTVTVMNYDHRPILEVIGVVITKLGSFGRAYFTAQSVKLIDAEEVKRFVIS